MMTETQKNNFRLMRHNLAGKTKAERAQAYLFARYPVWAPVILIAQEVAAANATS